ncbi:MAG: PhnD/SsuA/transferrin family substrate-binding protein [Acidimicrobiia bacterium]|nr:PhnD/SsuA/transferrin family substrate-binding protein [Acidimicrobiia bacterium]MBT8215128.1 PhnD/SsuA/transferrin family substrate-binding protein [Acidimicrobiia bacterium]NNF69888.1 PhnD/SsuA/transferrin family substrate-binding protein [Acidimicrobiia bacterium]
MRLRTLFIALVALALLATACGDAETTEGDTTTTTSGVTTTVDPKADWPDEIIFGFIPSERQETLQDNIEPFMDYIADEIGIDVTGVVTADYNGLVVALGTGGADFGAFGPFGYVQAKDQYPNIEVLIQSIRFGSDLYHGQWFTNDPSICDEPPVVGALENEGGTPVIKAGDEVAALQVGWAFGDAGLEQEVLGDGTEVDQGTACLGSLESIVGKSVAFTSSTSTSGAVFPQLQLLNLGIDVENDITYSYLGSHTDTVQAVYNGDFDIGLSFDDARRNIRKDADDNPLHPDVGSKVIVFNITDDIPNDVVAVDGDLPDNLKQAVYDAISKYLETEEGEAILDEIYGWTDIRPASEADFAVVRDAAEKLGVTED